MTDVGITFANEPVPADVVLSADAGGAALDDDPAGKSLSRWVASELAAGRPWAHVRGRVSGFGLARQPTRWVLLRLEPPPPKRRIPLGVKQAKG